MRKQNKDTLFYDASTRTYFTSSMTTIAQHVRDIFYDTYVEGYERSYVGLIRELQRRLEIPELEDRYFVDLYSTWQGKFLDVHYDYGCLSKGTPVIVILYA
jgi:hypothetical protein